MSFLADYLDHATNNEAPEMFHVWCGYSCLSAAISRRVWMKLDDSAIYPNLYVMLVGGAGNGKTWSLQKAKRIIAELDLPFSGSVETPQGMWRFMTGDNTAQKPIPAYGGAEHKLFLAWPDGIKREVHPMNIIASEFVDFINMDDKGWINALNNIYDEDVYHYRTKNMGADLITGPYINLLGGLTTQVSANMQKDQIINTGLARRTLFQFGERQWFNPRPRPNFQEHQQISRKNAVEHLQKVKGVQGEFPWTPETEEWYDEWYVKNLAQVPTRAPSVQSWYASKSTQLMKLAMLTSLSERLDRVLEVKHFQTALDYLDELEKDLYKIFGGVGQNELASVALSIFNHVSLLREPISFKDLCTRYFRDMPKGRGSLQQMMKDTLAFLINDNKLKAMSATYKDNETGQVINDIIYATPPLMAAFVEQQRKNAATPIAPQPEVQPELPQVSPPSIDPSSGPLPSLPVSSVAETQAAVPLQPETAISPLPILLPESN